MHTLQNTSSLLKGQLEVRLIIVCLQPAAWKASWNKTQATNFHVFAQSLKLKNQVFHWLTAMYTQYAVQYPAEHAIAL